MAERVVYVPEVAQLFPPQGRWTERDYYNLPDAMRIVELVRGELVMPPPPTTGHQRAVRKLAFALQEHVAARDLGEVLFAPLAVRLEENLVREPDVLFVSKANLDRVAQRGVEGAPDWVAEVISPGTRAADEVDKLAEYERAGVAEYWLLDTEARTVRVYVLREGQFQQEGNYSLGERAASVIVEGFGVAVEDVV